MATIIHTHTIYTQDEAAEIVAAMIADEDGWTYVAVNNPDPTGPKTTIIKVYDEDGVFIENF